MLFSHIQAFDLFSSNAQGYILVRLILCYVGAKALNGHSVLCWYSDLALMSDYC